MVLVVSPLNNCSQRDESQMSYETKLFKGMQAIMTHFCSVHSPNLPCRPVWLQQLL